MRGSGLRIARHSRRFDSVSIVSQVTKVEGDPHGDEPGSWSELFPTPEVWAGPVLPVGFLPTCMPGKQGKACGRPGRISKSTVRKIASPGIGTPTSFTTEIPQHLLTRRTSMGHSLTRGLMWQRACVEPFCIALHSVALRTRLQAARAFEVNAILSCDRAFFSDRHFANACAAMVEREYRRLCTFFVLPVHTFVKNGCTRVGVHHVYSRARSEKRSRPSVTEAATRNVAMGFP